MRYAIAVDTNQGRFGQVEVDISEHDLQSLFLMLLGTPGFRSLQNGDNDEVYLYGDHIDISARPTR